MCEDRATVIADRTSSNIDESVTVSSQFVLVRGDTLVDNTINENVVARGDTESTCTVDSGVNIQSLVHTESVVGDPAVDNTINEIVVGKGDDRGDNESTSTIDNGINIKSVVHTEHVDEAHKVNKWEKYKDVINANR